MRSRTETWRNDKTGEVKNFDVATDETVDLGNGRRVTYGEVVRALEAVGYQCKVRDLAVKSDGIDTSLTGGGEVPT